MEQRPKCTLDGCNSVAARGHKKKDGSWGKHKKLCSYHQKKKYGMPQHRGGDCGKYGKTLNIDRSMCVLCGWDKTPCDRHRVVFGCNGGKYTIKNVISVCPNCHRMLHMGLLEIKK